MCDNLSSHFGPDIDALFAEHHHHCLRRPVHSPDFAFVEWCFAHAQLFSKEYDCWLLEHPEEFGQVFAAGLLSLTPNYVRAYAADAHYFVPGVP